MESRSKLWNGTEEWSGAVLSVSELNMKYIRPSNHTIQALHMPRFVYNHIMYEHKSSNGEECSSSGL